MMNDVIGTINSAVVCDLDGTLIEGNLEQSFVNYLRRRGALDVRNYLCACVTYPVNALHKLVDKGISHRSWPIGLTDAELRGLTEDFMASPLCPTFNTKVECLVQGFQGEKLLLTGSDELLVNRFLNYSGRDSLFDKVIGLQGSGCRVLRHPYGRDKVSFLPEYAHLVGIGNEYADRYFLQECEVVCVREPDAKLARLANEKSWTVI